MTASWSRNLLAPLIFLSVTSFNSRALAEDPRIARAQAIYAEGVRAANEHRDAEALQKFKDAYAIYPGPNILAAIGREKQVLGQDLEAIRDLRAALRDPLLNPDNAGRLKAQIAEAEGKLGRLQVSGPEGAHIIVDEHEQTLPLREPIDVARGPFRVKATFAGKTKELSGDAKPGVVTPVALAFDAAGAEVTPPPTEEPKSNGTIWKPLTFVFGGATLVTGVLALYFNAKSHSANDRSTALRNEHAGSNCQVGSPPSFCGDIAAEDSDTRSAASASKGMWIGAGFLLALTGVSGALWATSKSSQPPARTALIPMAGPSTAGAALRMSF
jgi:tetratricopeptide (TPR) repeat protein